MAKKKLTVDGHGDVHEVVEPIKEFIIDWDKIARNVREALEEHERKQMVEQAPYHPGYEGAVIEQEKPKKTRAKKQKA